MRNDLPESSNFRPSERDIAEKEDNEEKQFKNIWIFVK